jgi:ElaB/YqjD/DUF883 family membrane-anchored ribosome-binding protein
LIGGSIGRRAAAAWNIRNSRRRREFVFVVRTRRRAIMDNGAISDVDDLRSNFNQLRTDFSNLTKTVSDISERRAAAGAEKLRSFAAEANSLKDAGLESATRHVVEHPVSSLLVAFSAGLLLGKLADRR